MKHRSLSHKKRVRTSASAIPTRTLYQCRTMKQSAGTIKSNALSTCKRRSLNTTRFFSLQRSVYNQSPFFSPATSAVYRQKHSRPLRFASQPVSLFSTSFRDDSSDNDSTAEHRDGDRDGVSESSQETNADFLKLMHLYAATQNMNENDGESDDDDEYDFDDDDDEEDDDEDGVESAGVDYSVIKNPRFRALYEQGDQGGGLEGMMAMMQDNQQYEDEEDDDDELDEEEVGEEQKPGTLYLVSTPIGNLGEVSPRALRILSTVDVIACEDTRKTGLLLAQLGVRKKDDSQAKPLSGSGSSNNSNGSGNNGSEQRNRASKKQRLAMRKKAKDDKANDQEYESKLNLAYQLSGSDDSSHGNSGDCSALQLPSVSSDVDTQWQGWRDAALLSRVSASQAWKQNTTRARLISYHDHNEHTKFKDLITLLRRGKNMALVSDAGTPAISDPGFLLVNALRRLDIGVDVLPVSGPCAAIAALTISGLPTHRFAFEGFLPPKQNARIATLQNLKDEDRTLIFYESRHRITRCLADMEEVYGNTREIALVKELTKVHHAFRRGSIASVRAWLNEDPKRSRGEFVLCVGADQSKKKRKAGEGLGAQDVKVLKVLLEAGLSTKDASSIAMKLTSGSKKQLYEEALQIKKTLNIKPIRRKR